MTDHRAKPQNLMLVSAVPYGSSYVYHGALPIEDMSQNEFYLPVRSNLRMGDSIKIQQIGEIKDGTKQVVAVRHVLVASISGAGIKLHLNDIEMIPDMSSPAEPKAPLEPVIYVPTDCYARHKAAALFDVVRRDNDEVLATVTGKELAQSIASGSAPLPA
jgi:hypothetical protein